MKQTLGSVRVGNRRSKQFLHMKSIWLALVLIALLAMPGRLHAEAQPTHPPPPPADPAFVGTGVQRTMTLLATSTPQKRNKVRILFYGQSITVQDWSKQVADDLRKRFPHADLEIQNRAIGGFASQMLIKPAEHDLYPFYPDLLIFHVYGANNTYEQIIKSVRTRTAAEVLMQTDHVAARGVADKPDEKGDKALWWDWMMNNRFLPEYAKKYGCTLLDIRGPWVQYLKQNDLQPQALLKDGVHLNDHGCWLMAQLVSRHLVHRPAWPNDAWKDLATTYEVGKDVQWKDGRLTLPFDGNRVDLLPAAGADGSTTVQVRIDGRKPSEFPGCYAITRPSPGPWTALTVVRIDHEKPLVLEDWTLTITDAAAKTWSYEVAGSVTGPDGAGDSSTPFTSKSGRVKIDPSAFFGKGEVQPGYKIRWKVVPMFADEVKPDIKGDPSREHAATVAQGIPNGKHTLELTTDAKSPAMSAIRVYRPPVSDEK